MSEQLKQDAEKKLEIARLETETGVDSKTIGQDETELPESKLEDESGNEVKAEDTVYLGKASLAEILTGMADPTEEEIRAAEIENAKPVKQKAKEKLEAEKKKATQKNFAESIIAYLLKRCEEDQGFAEDVMQEGKTWNKCFSYIVEQARKQSNGRFAAVEDQVVYEWAEDYYHKKYEKPEPVKKEKGKKAVITKKSVTPTKTTQKITDNEKKSQETKDKPQISEKPVKKDAASKQRKTEKTSTKSSELSGQMSLFDLL